MDPVTNTWLYKVLIHEASVGLCLVDDGVCCAGVPWAFFCLQQPLLFLALHLQSFAYSLSAALSEFAHISSRIAWANYILATPTGSLKCKLAI